MNTGIIFGIVLLLILFLVVVTMTMQQNTTDNKPQEMISPNPSAITICNSELPSDTCQKVGCLNQPTGLSQVTGVVPCNNGILVPNLGTFPSNVIILRHCDRAFNISPEPEPSTTVCAGSVSYPASVQTNCCSKIGMERAWYTGQWLNCHFDNPVKAIFSQCFLGSQPNNDTNGRPNTTASIILTSLQKSGNTDICYFTMHRDISGNTLQAAQTVAKALTASMFNNTNVVIVWSHENIAELTKTILAQQNPNQPVTQPPSNWSYPGDCFDGAVVLSKDVSGLKFNWLNMQTLPSPDPCSIQCSNSIETAQPSHCSNNILPICQ